MMEREIVYSKQNRKVAITCFGGRISLDADNVRTIDFIYLRDILQNIYGRTVDFVSRPTKKEKELSYYKDIDNVDLNDYDEVFIYNSQYQPFGGIFSSEAIETFEKLTDYKGDMWYYLADPKMPFTDFSLYLKSRLVDGKINTSDECGYRKYDEEYFDNWSKNVYPKIKIAYSGSNYNVYYNLYMNKLTHNNTKEPNALNVLNPNYEWAFIPLFEYYSVNEDLEAKLHNVNYSKKSYDLIYFGNNRQTERNKIIKSLYNRKGYNNYVLGFDPEWDLCKYSYSGYVSHEEMFNIIPFKAYATVILGDTLHNDNIRTARFFESMLLDIVAFIWHEYDPTKRFVENQELKDFIYVKTPEELERKVNKIKNDEQFYHHIVELERQDILNQFNKYKVEKTKNTTSSIKASSNRLW